MELSGSNIKKFLIFSQKKAFLKFREMKLFYILENGSPEKILYISGNGTFLYFDCGKIPGLWKISLVVENFLECKKIP